MTADFVLPDRHLIAPPTVTARIEVGKERFEKKDEAFRLHMTQKPLFERVKKNLGQGLGTLEMYHLVATRDPREAKMRNGPVRRSGGRLIAAMRLLLGLLLRRLR